MKKSLLLTSFILFICLGIDAQTDVSPYIPGKNADVVNYFLPKTVIEFEIEATKTTYSPGEFSKYADRYLRLTGISDKADEYWEIDNIKVTSTGIPDPDHAYSVKLKDKTVAPLVELTSDGILVSINKPLEKKVVPAAEVIPAKKVRPNPRDFMTQEILLAGSSAKMADLVANEIYNIRESKSAITRGQADNMPVDGAAIKIMLNSLDEQEEAMLGMFTGITDKETKKFTVRLVPNGNIEKDPVFRFSRKLGVVDKNDLSGTPIYVTLTDLKTVPAPDPNLKKKKSEGVVYNVAGSAQIKVFTNNKTYFEGTFPIAQFGNQETLDSSLFNKKTTTVVTFDPKTGGIVKIDRNE